MLGATHAKDFKGTCEMYGIARDHYYTILKDLRIPAIYWKDLQKQQSNTIRGLELEAKAVMKGTKGWIWAGNSLLDIGNADLRHFPPTK
jgi:hypothetical protein